MECNYQFKFNFNNLTPVDKYSDAQKLLKDYIKLKRENEILLVFTKDRNSLKLLGQNKTDTSIINYIINYSTVDHPILLNPLIEDNSSNQDNLKIKYFCNYKLWERSNEDDGGIELSILYNPTTKPNPLTIPPRNSQSYLTIYYPLNVNKLPLEQFVVDFEIIKNLINKGILGKDTSVIDSDDNINYSMNYYNKINQLLSSISSSTAATTGSLKSTIREFKQNLNEGGNESKFRNELDFADKLWNIFKFAPSLSHIEESLLSIYKQLLSGDLLPIFMNDYQSQIGVIYKNTLIETAKIKYKKENIQNKNIIYNDLFTLPINELIVDLGMSKMIRDYLFTFKELKCLNITDIELLIPKLEDSIKDKYNKLECLNYLLCVNTALRIIGIPYSTIHSILTDIIIHHFSSTLFNPSNVVITSINLPLYYQRILPSKPYYWYCEIESNNMNKSVEISCEDCLLDLNCSSGLSVKEVNNLQGRLEYIPVEMWNLISIRDKMLKTDGFFNYTCQIINNQFH